jgi:hypothetical protein
VTGSCASPSEHDYITSQVSPSQSPTHPRHHFKLTHTKHKNPFRAQTQNANAFTPSCSRIAYGRCVDIPRCPCSRRTTQSSTFTPRHEAGPYLASRHDRVKRRRGIIFSSRFSHEFAKAGVGCFQVLGYQCTLLVAIRNGRKSRSIKVIPSYCPCMRKAQ